MSSVTSSGKKERLEGRFEYLLSSPSKEGNLEILEEEADLLIAEALGLLEEIMDLRELTRLIKEDE